MSLVQPVVALFYSLLEEHDIEMKFFDTTFYDISDKYVDPNKYLQDLMIVKQNDASELKSKLKVPKPRAALFAEFRKEIEDFQPHVLLVSAVESTVLLAREMLQSVRDLNIPTVLGGVFATYAPKLAISFDEVDFICVGEAEEVLVPLVQGIVAGKDVSKLGGIWTKTKDGITQSPLAAPVDLDKMPRFDASVFDDSRFYRAMAGEIYKMFPIESHRGCPLVCTFCNSPVQNEMYKKETNSKYFRPKSIDKVMEDVRYVVEEKGAEYLFFWADNFLAYSKEETNEFCRQYSEFKIPFYAQSYPTTLNEYKIEKLAGVGLHRLGMGFEHGNEKFRKEVINRPYSNQKAIEQTTLLKKYDFTYSLNNIVGFPTETPELHMDTVKLNRLLNPHTASCSTFTPFHGTPLREMALKKGYLKDPDLIAPTNTERSILDMPQFTPDQIYGKARTFNLYLKFPENRWHHIQQAERLTPEGNKIWHELKQEYAEKYEDDD
jgi:radical SAM superfamily enzyme YgiQ (UPF0313 family)